MMFRFAKVLILVFVVMAMFSGVDSWSYGRWEKKLKLTFNYDGDPTNYSMTGGMVSSFIRKGIASTWTNQFSGKYVETATGLSGNSKITLTEIYEHNIGVFTYWKLYGAANDQALNGTIGSQSTLVIGKHFSRYVNFAVGPEADTAETAAGTLTSYLRVEGLVERPFGYRTTFSFAPVLQFLSTDMANVTLSATINLSYKLGNKISLDVCYIPNYNTVSESFGSYTTVDLVYDAFMY